MLNMFVVLVAALMLAQPAPLEPAPAQSPPSSVTPTAPRPNTPAPAPTTTTPAPPNATGSNPAAASTAQRLADDQFQPLLDRFNRLHQSLMGRRGIGPGDRPVIEKFRNDARAFLSDHPGDTRAIAMLITLSSWLKDHDEVDALYKQLVALRPDDAKVRISWAGYFRNLNRFTYAKQILEDGKLDPATYPTAAKWIVDALVAGGRYDEALTVLATIPEDAIKLDPMLQQEITQLRPGLEKLPAQWEAEKALRESEAAADDLPRVEIVTDKGRIVVELFENQAPNTTANFITLIESGFYDGTRFHRVIPAFMAQGGDPNSKPGSNAAAGTGGPGYAIADEVTREDHRLHFPDSLAMAKSNEPNTAGSQFYLSVTAAPWLNDKHTVFGRVLEGMDVVRALEPNDTLTSAKVLRKRPHEYVVEKLPLPERSVNAAVPAAATRSAPISAPAPNAAKPPTVVPVNPATTTKP